MSRIFHEYFLTAEDAEVAEDKISPIILSSATSASSAVKKMILLCAAGIPPIARERRISR
jgi:hypothetical protein